MNQTIAKLTQKIAYLRNELQKFEQALAAVVALDAEEPRKQVAEEKDEELEQKKTARPLSPKELARYTNLVAEIAERVGAAGEEAEAELKRQAGGEEMFGAICKAVCGIYACYGKIHQTGICEAAGTSHYFRNNLYISAVLLHVSYERTHTLRHSHVESKVWHWWWLSAGHTAQKGREVIYAFKSLRWVCRHWRGVDVALYDRVAKKTVVDGKTVKDRPRKELFKAIMNFYERRD